ncbi:MAG: DUF4301 family protein [Bacteroidales bacterium]|jgi:hypothetical protein|nr:DUF4301 family protein [Bacteroidales bacterium]
MTKNIFSEKELAQIRQHGISEDAVNRQLLFVNQEKTNVELLRPALLSDGVFSITGFEKTHLLNHYQEQITSKRIVKFVPASGAATRMFQDLLPILNRNHLKNCNEPMSASVLQFLEHLSQFAFYEELSKIMPRLDPRMNVLLDNKDYPRVVRYLLQPKGLNYANIPKGLVLFHRYPDGARTAFEEHLMEAPGYICTEDAAAHLHFTVSDKHLDAFQTHCTQILPLYQKRFDVEYHIRFSVQRSSTDTIAFTMNNEPFRDTNGQLVFRPGGHGSLIDNLNSLKADIVMIKNIDNVTLDVYKSDTILYKRLLLSFLLSLQSKVFELLKDFDRQLLSQEKITQAETFLQEMFFMRFSSMYRRLSLEEKRDYLYRLLHRPIRVCGVVQRENEPGGGPFWIKHPNGEVSLQIVETSEIDLRNPRQKAILNKSEYFNPVDLACSLRDHRGEWFNLNDYVDHSRYFTSEKSHKGKPLRAIENPGLWNGAMSDWLTVFVEVPLSTFTPVKTINDLLRKEHVGKA